MPFYGGILREKSLENPPRRGSLFIYSHALLGTISAQLFSSRGRRRLKEQRTGIGDASSVEMNYVPFEPSLWIVPPVKEPHA